MNIFKKKLNVIDIPIKHLNFALFLGGRKTAITAENIFDDRIIPFFDEQNVSLLAIEN